MWTNASEFRTGTFDDDLKSTEVGGYWPIWDNELFGQMANNGGNNSPSGNSFDSSLKSTETVG